MMSTRENERKGLKPLKVVCKSADCESGLHYFKPTRRMIERAETGRCRYCGAELVDWPRFRKLDVSDTAYVFECLKYEMFRHYMWHVEVDQRAINYARRKGLEGMRSAAENRLRKYLGPANPPFDGRQTPREGSGNPICYAQHAVAACCRKCMEYWYCIGLDRCLTDDEIAYFVELIMRYVDDRLPPLTKSGERVPPIRKQ
jgi:hypothetical protein